MCQIGTKDTYRPNNLSTMQVQRTGLKLFIGSKVLCMFCVEICTPEGRGGEKDRNANVKTKLTGTLTQVHVACCITSDFGLCFMIQEFVLQRVNKQKVFDKGRRFSNFSLASCQTVFVCSRYDPAHAKKLQEFFSSSSRREKKLPIRGLVALSCSSDKPQATRQARLGASPTVVGMLIEARHGHKI